MLGKHGQSMVPLIWVSAALISGVLLHVDRVPLWTTGTVFLWVGWRFAAELRRVRFPSTFAKVGVTFLLMVAVIAQFRTVNGLAAGTALLVVMGALKLLETHTGRDRNIVIGASLFLLLAACLDRQSLTRAPLYLAHAWICCAALGVTTRGKVAMSNRATALMAARSLALAAPLALVLFLFFPRMVGAFWTLPESGQASTGLSESMSPGSISELSESDEPVFRVHFEGALPPPEERYWRGPVLHEFDGYTWKQIPGQIYVARKLEYLGPAYRYSVTLEPSGQRWWFALDTVVDTPNPRRAYLTFDRQLYARDPVTQTTSYDATSYTRTRSEGNVPIIAKRIDTKLPADRNVRSVELARQMRANVGNDEEFVGAVLNLFRSGGFAYTLTPPLLDLNSVDDFIFNTKSGFCGHFASAFVTMMRSAGVPSRVVTGYQGGEWNRIRDYLLIRQSDAHAWAEVWLDGKGWTRVDPTAVVAPERMRRSLRELQPSSAQDRLVSNTPWLFDMRQRWDAVNDWWNEHVVRFNMATQLDLLRSLGIQDPDWTSLGYLLAGGLLTWMAIVGWQVARSVHAPHGDRLARAYQKLCAKLARAGTPREPHEGPMAFAAALATKRPDLSRSAGSLLADYTRLRFGNQVAESAYDDAVKAFERSVRQFTAR